MQFAARCDDTVRDNVLESPIQLKNWRPSNETKPRFQLINLLDHEGHIDNELVILTLNATDIAAV